MPSAAPSGEPEACDHEAENRLLRERVSFLEEENRSLRELKDLPPAYLSSEDETADGLGETSSSEDGNAGTPADEAEESDTPDQLTVRFARVLGKTMSEVHPVASDDEGEERPRALPRGLDFPGATNGDFSGVGDGAPTEADVSDLLAELGPGSPPPSIMGSPGRTRSDTPDTVGGSTPEHILGRTRSGRPRRAAASRRSDDPPGKPVASFVRTLAMLLEGPGEETLVEWSENGRRVFFPDPTEFADTVCPQHFRHANWTSFARMLNMYEFRKCAAAPLGDLPPKGRLPPQVFEHDKFRRGGEAHFHRVKRRPTKRKKAGDDGPKGETSGETDRMRTRIKELEARLSALELENETLKSRFQYLPPSRTGSYLPSSGELFTSDSGDLDRLASACAGAGSL